MAHSLSEDEITRLIQAARDVREMAYAPYSQFSVGAAAMSSDGTIYTGCNVENASYGLTVCAERNAFFKSVSEGRRNFRAIAIYAGTDEFCSPCGACRQVIAEFGRDVLVVQVNNRGQYKINTIEELLPGGFSGQMLGREIVE